MSETDSIKLRERRSLRAAFTWRASESVEALLPRLAVITAASFGIVYLFLMPPFQVPDELGHFNRAIGIGYGHCLGQSPTLVPRAEVEFETAFPSFIEQQKPARRWISRDDLVRWLRTGPSSPLLPMGNFAANLYSCLPYLPSAAAISMARASNMPPLVMLYAGRVTNLLMFLCLLFAAMRALPDFRLMLFGLAVMPMTLHQAASASADSMTIGVTFCLLAYILKLSFDRDVRTIGRRELLILSALVFCSSLMKFNLWLILLTFFIPVAKFLGQWHRSRVIAGLLLLACVAALGWQTVNRHNVNEYLAQRRADGFDVVGNARFSRRHPRVILKNIATSFSVNRDRMVQMFVGAAGYITVPLPVGLAWTYLGCLLLLGVTQAQRVSLTIRQRLLLVFIVLASAISIFALIFNFETEISYLQHQPVIARPIAAFHGRYFIPFALLFFLLFSYRKLRVPPAFGLVIILSASACSNASAYYLIWQEYYKNASMKTLQVHAVRWPNGQMFLFVNGRLHRIPDIRTLNSLSFREAPITGDSTTQRWLVDSDLPSIPGRVIRTAELPDIFVLENGARRGIPNPPTQVALGLTDVVVIPKRDMEALPQGMPLDPIDEGKH